MKSFVLTMMGTAPMDYRWSVSRAAQALGFNVSRFASMEDRLAVAS